MTVCRRRRQRRRRNYVAVNPNFKILVSNLSLHQPRTRLTTWFTPTAEPTLAWGLDWASSSPAARTLPLKFIYLHGFPLDDSLAPPEILENRKNGGIRSASSSPSSLDWGKQKSSIARACLTLLYSGTPSPSFASFQVDLTN